MQRSRGRIAIAIAGGPNGGTTPILLDTLAALEQTASFFLEPDLIGRNPHIAHRVVQDGHDAGLLGPDACEQAFDYRSYLDRAIKDFEDVTGCAALSYMDRTNADLSRGANEARLLGLKIVRSHFNVPMPASGHPALASANGLHHLTDESIVTLDGTETENLAKFDFERAQLLASLIGHLRTGGFEIVSLPNL